MYVFIVFAPSSSRLSRVVPPCSSGTSGAPAPGSSQDPVSSRSRSRNDSNTVPVSVSIIHLFKSTLQVLYIRRMSSEYLRALQTSWRGWADSKAVHSMECRGGALALLEDYPSVGAAACDAPYCQRWEAYYLKLILTLKELNNRLTSDPMPGWYLWLVTLCITNQWERVT